MALSIVLMIVISACNLLPFGEQSQAPPACGFPDGTALAYAGRSTTSALGVQEAVGDVMSDDPADIYITRDEFDQGELHGRLVCAIYVDQPDFVEVTVHPGDLEPLPEPTPAATAPPNGISGQEATGIAFAEVEDPQAWDVFGVQAGPLATFLPDFEDYEWSRDLSPDRWVWVVAFVQGDQSVDVYVDFVEGTVLGKLEGIIN